MSKKNCVSCQANLDADAIFCNECGTVQAAAVSSAAIFETPATLAFKTCPQCQKQIDASVKFCSGCAFDFTKPPITKTASICPNCQKIYGSDDRFCRHCAFDLSQIAKSSSAHFCTTCGKPFETTDKFCRSCAADLSKSNHTVAVPIISANPNFSPPQNSMPNFPPIITPSQPNFPPIIAPNQSPTFFSPPPIAPPTPISANRENAKPNGIQWITPSMAGIALICFFMPWVEVSCNAFGSKVAGKTASGADLAQFDGSLWLLPILAIGILVVFFVFKSQGKLLKARPFIMIGAGLALLFMIFKALNLDNSTRGMPNMSFGSEWRTGLDIESKFGIWGIVLGFIASLVSAAFLKNDIVSPSPNFRNSSVATAALPYQIAPGADALKSKIIAGFCYLVPAFSPLLFILVINGIMGGTNNEFVFFLLLVLTFVFQAVFLKFLPQTDSFVKFHAAQSICYFAAYLVIGFAYFQILTAFFGTTPFYRVLSAVFFPIETRVQFSFPLMIAQWIIPVFLAVMAFIGRFFKFGFIGDWAMKLEQKVVVK